MTDQKFFRKNEVVIHNQLHDCWIIVNETVFDLTSLFVKRQNSINDVRLTVYVTSYD